MQVDVVFDFARVYTVDNKIDVVKGQKFSLLTDLIGDSKWFSDNDHVLAIVVTGNNADVEATDIGTSTILIMGLNFGIHKELTITVVETVDRAINIGAEAGPPELK